MKMIHQCVWFGSTSELDIMRAEHAPYDFSVDITDQLDTKTVLTFDTVELLRDTVTWYARARPDITFFGLTTHPDMTRTYDIISGENFNIIDSDSFVRAVGLYTGEYINHEMPAILQDFNYGTEDDPIEESADDDVS